MNPTEKLMAMYPHILSLGGKDVNTEKHDF